MIVRRVLLGLCVAVLAVSARAQDVAGKWSGSVDNQGFVFEMVFEFVVMGAELTGALINDFIGEIPIVDGMVNGDEISFRLTIDGGPGGAMTINYSGVVDGDGLELTSTFEGAPPGGGPAEQTIMLSRTE